MLRNSALANAVVALDAKMRREVKQHLFWSKFTGEIEWQESPYNEPSAKMSGKFIEVSKKKATGLGDRMIFPMLLELAGPGRRGDAILLGYEEDMARKYAMIAYNQIRHAVPMMKGKKDYSNEKLFNMMEYCMPQLAWWHAQQENWEVTSALYEGASEALTLSGTDAVYGQGMGLSKRYHPNLYTWVGSSDAAGALTLAASTAGKFPTADNVWHAVKNTGTNDADLGTNLTLTTYTARAIRNLCIQKKIRPLFHKNGKQFWGAVISSEQADTLRADSRYVEAQKTFQTRDYTDNPYVDGSIGIYEQIVWFEDNLITRGFAGTAVDGSDLNILGSTPLVWTESEKSNPRFENMTGRIAETGGKYNHVLTVFGASGLGKSDEDPLGFEDEKFDYNNWKGIAASTMYGYGRFDNVGESQIMLLETAPASCTNVYNRGSLQVITWQ